MGYVYLRQEFASKKNIGSNALVICNHGPPEYERDFDQTLATAAWGKYLGFALYRHKGW